MKIIIDHTKPSENAPKHTGFSKAGKINKKVVKKLLKVVIDDIEYELSCKMDYVASLKNEIKRFEKIDYYDKKRSSSKKEKQKLFYEEYMKIYLKNNESIDDFKQLYKE